MAIRRSLRLPRRAETRMAAREEQVLVEPIVSFLRKLKYDNSIYN